MTEEASKFKSVMTDTDNAKDLQKRMIEALGPVAAIIREANVNGMTINFNIGFDQFFQQKISVTVTKVLVSYP